MLLLSLPLLLAAEPQQFTHAEMLRMTDEAKITRLSPMDFDEVPPNIQKELSDMGCTIPQVDVHSDKAGPHNVISGEFAVKGQIDWAAMCSVDGISKVVVLWGGPERCPQLGKAAPDKERTQYRGKEYGMRFDEIISTYPADAEALHETHSEYSDAADARLPKKRSHDAINFYIVDKAGVSYYCHEGEWLQLITAD